MHTLCKTFKEDLLEFYWNLLELFTKICHEEGLQNCYELSNLTNDFLSKSKEKYCSAKGHNSIKINKIEIKNDVYKLKMLTFDLSRVKENSLTPSK